MVGFVGFADLIVLPGGKDRDRWLGGAAWNSQYW